MPLDQMQNRYRQPWYMWIAIALDFPIAFLLRLVDLAYGFDWVGDLISRHLRTANDARTLRLMGTGAIAFIVSVGWLGSRTSEDPSLQKGLTSAGAVYLICSIAVASHDRKPRKILPDQRPLCGKCQYDLTGNVSGDCPECGTAADQLIPPLKLVGK